MERRPARGTVLAVAVLAGVLVALGALVTPALRPTDEQGLVIHCPSPVVVLLTAEPDGYYSGAHADNIGGTDIGFEPPSAATAQRLCQEAAPQRVMPSLLAGLAAAVVAAAVWLTVRPMFEGASTAS